MACNYKIFESAQVELRSILLYLTRVSGGSSAAKAFLDEFERSIALVCDNPAMFSISRMPELSSLGYRVVQVKSYIVLYSHRENEVLVAHIFHQRQDYARLV